MSTKNVGILLGVITIEKEREKRARDLYMDFYLCLCAYMKHMSFRFCVCVCLARGPHMGGGSARMTMRLWKVVVA